MRSVIVRIEFPLSLAEHSGRPLQISKFLNPAPKKIPTIQRFKKVILDFILGDIIQTKVPS